LAAAKHWRQQNIGIGKCWRDKYWCRQNTGVKKILASTKSRHRQNVGACAEASPYCFGLAKSAAAEFSQTSPMFSYFSLKMLHSPRAINICAVAAVCPAFMGGHSWPALYRLICTGPPCRKCHKYWCRQNICGQDFTDFRQTIAVNISVHRHPYQKLIKAKSNHHHCPISIFLPITSILRPSQISNSEVSQCPKWGRSHGGGGGRRGGRGPAIVFISSR
jgi:hypothetical protein